MKLMMTTQCLDRNHPIQGFVHRWCEVLGERVDRLHVVANEVRPHDLPESVTVHSLGKEDGAGRFRKGLRLLKATREVLTTSGVDGVFVHQIELYGLLIWPLVRLHGVPVLQFKAHKGVPWTLRAANGLFDGFVTSSKGGLQLPEDRKLVIGQGIDTERFAPDGSGRDPERFRVLSVGRISPVKDYETLLRAFERLVEDRGLSTARLTIVGGPGTPQQQGYLEDLRSMARRRGLGDRVEFVPPVPNREVPDLYREADVFVNLSRTGSLDKAVLEAMASGVPVVTSNWAFEAVFPGPLRERLMVEPGDDEAVSGALLEVSRWDADTRRDITHRLRRIVVEDHNLQRFMERLVDVFETCSRTSWEACRERFRRRS